MKKLMAENTVNKSQKTQQPQAEDPKTVSAQQPQITEKPKEQSPPASKAQAQQSMSESPPKPVVVKRENYCKFERVEKPLSQMLERSIPEKEMAANLKISLPTLHKYKNILTIRNKKIYMTPEEERFLKKHTTATPPASSAPAKPERGGQS